MIHCHTRKPILCQILRKQRNSTLRHTHGYTHRMSEQERRSCARAQERDGR